MSESLQMEKITRVTVYTAMCEHAAECWEVLELVRENEIPHSHFNWHNPEEVPGVIEPFKTMNFFDGEDWYMREDVRLPIVEWETLYDDVTLRHNIAIGVDELKDSQLWKNLDKVV